MATGKISAKFSKNQDKTFVSHTLILNKRLCMTDFLFKYTMDLGGSMAAVSIEYWTNTVIFGPNRSDTDTDMPLSVKISEYVLELVKCLNQVLVSVSAWIFKWVSVSVNTWNIHVVWKIVSQLYARLLLYSTILAYKHCMVY